MSNKYYSFFTPGLYVINKDNNKWSVGQIQSRLKNIIIVYFENIKKKVININEIDLEITNI